MVVILRVPTILKGNMCGPPCYPEFNSNVRKAQRCTTVNSIALVQRRIHALLYRHPARHKGISTNQATVLIPAYTQGADCHPVRRAHSLMRSPAYNVTDVAFHLQRSYR